MDFQSFINSGKILITEGSIYERLRRFPNLALDLQVANAGLIYEPESAKILGNIVQEYLAVGKQFGLPMITLTNTWRANKERVAQSQYKTKNINVDCTKFYRELIKDLNSLEPVYLGGLMGCRGDAYKAEESLSEKAAYEFHSKQATDLAAGGADFLFASTLPAFEEAKGLARAMAETGLPYILSFVLRADGTLLDGISLKEAITEIDNLGISRPIRFMINCSHTSAFRAAYPHFSAVSTRVAGLQANTSARDPLELDGIDELETEEPRSFGVAMSKLREDFKIQVLGGCCGTGTEHIEALARELSKLNE